VRVLIRESVCVCESERVSETNQKEVKAGGGEGGGEGVSMFPNLSPGMPHPPARPSCISCI